MTALVQAQFVVQVAVRVSCFSSPGPLTLCFRQSQRRSRFVRWSFIAWYARLTAPKLKYFVDHSFG